MTMNQNNYMTVKTEVRKRFCLPEHPLLIKSLFRCWIIPLSVRHVAIKMLVGIGGVCTPNKAE